ncbi:MAG: L-2-amino-thiazoline-4-carboxylic acid hydrolase [Peptostreptococcaceae bacterium]|nr:L-2-amino-thiazoline-4-carboxylic acid hydrolase [Peptostreptococcaceae bacterium]
MKLKDHYSSKLDAPVLEKLDAVYEEAMKELIDQIERGDWTGNQKKRQKASILPNIALYRSFIRLGIPKDRAKELVRERAYAKAHKLHDVLAAFFRIPRFSKVFRFFMRKGMSGDEIWHTTILSDDDKGFVMDITKCLWKDTCSHFGCPEICEIFCSSDHIVFGNIDKLEFLRSQTLGMDGSKCDFDFRFRKHG